MSSLSGPAIPMPMIQVYGLLGTFRIGTGNFIVKYMSTFANPMAEDRLGGHRKLLEELKPMRDRLDAFKLHNLSSLLQRDLNDRRVAQELIPYLLGEGTGIGFFPAILAVLVPRGYLAEAAGDPRYPAPVQNANNPLRTEYGGCWAVTPYTMQGQVAPLGLLDIMRGSTDIVVLDGQHRANAFRFLSGDFDPSKSIYQPFYEGLPEPEPLNADLPVTLIWFESESPENQINPQLISRRLFVDVNNTAKTVSLARTILLNDRAATCLGTQELYNRAAQDNGFSAGRFSLLHGGFDADLELAARRQHKFMLTTPEIIYDALRWALFGNTTYDGLGCYRVSRLRQPQNLSRFQNIFSLYSLMPKGSADEEKQDSFFGPYFDTPETADSFRGAFSKTYLPILWALFNELSLLTPHYEAGAEVANAINTGPSPTEKDVWDKVFCGGEGLYWSLDLKGKNSSPENDSMEAAVISIEKKFVEARAKRFGQELGATNGVYDSFLTKAFQIGYVGAVEYLSRELKEGDYTEAASDLVAHLNDYTHTQWAAIFTELKPFLSSGIDPKSWPLYRNLLLRMYDGDRGNFYDAFNREKLFETPDGMVYQKNLEAAKGQLLVAYEDSAPPEAEVLQRSQIALDKTRELLNRCGLSAGWFTQDVVRSHGERYLKQQIESYYKV